MWRGCDRAKARAVPAGFRPPATRPKTARRMPHARRGASASALSSAATGFATSRWTSAQAPSRSRFGPRRPRAAASSRSAWTSRTGNCWALVRCRTRATGRTGFPSRPGLSRLAGIRRYAWCLRRPRRPRLTPHCGLPRWTPRTPPSGRSSRASTPTSNWSRSTSAGPCSIPSSRASTTSPCAALRCATPPPLGRRRRRSRSA